MDKQSPKILVAGAGAIGGITAALLKREGYDVEIIAKYKEYTDLIMSKGLHVTGARGTFDQPMKAWTEACPEMGMKDIILLATKATDVIESCKSVLPYLKEDGLIVSLQNGICEDDIAEITGRKRLVGCVVAWGGTMDRQGDLFMSSEGEFIIGYTDRGPDSDLEFLADMLSVIVPVKQSDNIIGHLYSKMIVNSCITCLGAISGLHLGQMLKRRKFRKIFIAIMREAMAVADKMKIKVEKFGGKVDFYGVAQDTGFIAEFRRHLLIRIIGFKYRKLKSSSLQSLERGKPTEIDFFNGYILKNADKYGVDAPVNAIIVKMIHEIESGKRKMSLENFIDPSFDLFD